jgi:hypothetical protein
MSLDLGAGAGAQVTTPEGVLTAASGIRPATSGAAQPACDATSRGTFWFTYSASGVKDAAAVCAKDAANAYAWRTIY